MSMRLRARVATRITVYWQKSEVEHTAEVIAHAFCNTFCVCAQFKKTFKETYDYKK